MLSFFFFLTICWLNNAIFVHLFFRCLKHTVLLKVKTRISWLIESIEWGYIFLTTFQILLPALSFSGSFLSQITRRDTAWSSLESKQIMLNTRWGLVTSSRKMPFPDALCFAMRWLDDLADPEFLYLINKRGFGKQRLPSSSWRQSCGRSTPSSEDCRCALSINMSLLSQDNL